MLDIPKDPLVFTFVPPFVNDVQSDLNGGVLDKSHDRFSLFVDAEYAIKN
ncbi:hypothetical protein PM8797T_23354 [Gimesia maris DSM 8797]|nr:hypothetical protein PM8797T_23354 [Gimesia maris DSM 8797]